MSGLLSRLMGKKEDSLEDLEDDLERVGIQSEIAETRAAISEKEALIAEARKKYGRDWKRILGLRGPFSIESLKSLLKSGSGLSQVVRAPGLQRAMKTELSGGTTGSLQKQSTTGGNKLKVTNAGEKLRERGL